jgi:hypothetical protein
MQVDAIMSSGNRAQLQVQMTPSWSVLTSYDGVQLELFLQAIMPSISAGLIYLFAPSDARFGAVDALPAAAVELLLFAPLVPLLKCPEGFQIMSWSAWKDVALSTCFQDFGMPSSMVSSAAALEDDEDLDSASLDSYSNAAESEDKTADEIGDESDILEDGEDSDACSDVSV